MKISTNNVINNYTDLRLHTKDNSVPGPVSDGGRSYDAIIIQSDPKEIEEHHFAKSLSHQISSEIRNTASADKIQNLQNQVHAQTYQIDPHAIAAKMLLV
ncbi:MAG: flagellar biosynthesis anti-sigma factor FlgM [Hespellia sp.]|jgi:anti-sigma28 factor (negative regulator of flagellin synthesis)|nr:flagellar biosynthesis anti-sigma factor FlgM [Hespellia sp.]